MLRQFLIALAFLSGSASASAIEVRILLGACKPGFGCSWDLRIAANRELALEVHPQAHQSKRFVLSRKAYSDLQALIRREDFFSLPEHLGALVVDGPQASIEVKDGKKSKRVVLDKLPEEWQPIWRSDTGATGRAFRVCEEVRALAGVSELLRCPGIPPVDGKE